ncbi:MAG TPA: phosphonoacetaldehyde reductase [Planctomicrobium sp.]|nr:phosphonoacetaldehyde reductase [Planctomicrobium sp.]
MSISVPQSPSLLDMPALKGENPSPRFSRQSEILDERCLDSIARLPKVLEELQAQSLFAVIDATAFTHSGADRRLAPIFAQYKTTCFSEFEPNPKLQDVLVGLKQFRRSKADVVLAIGGGTAIDIAKLIAACSTGTQDLLSVINNKESFSGTEIPLIAIPTTSGTGSEATQFAVVYVEGVKHSVDHPRLLPSYCVLDPQLTLALPARITAQTGLDAFCQAVESMWSVYSNEVSFEYAREAAALAFENLAEAVQNSTPESRQGMSRASHLAGRAINYSRTTACHAISYTLTSDFGIPHGHAVALTLGPMLEFNAALSEADNNDSRGVIHVQQSIQQILSIIGCETPEQGRQRLDDWIRSLGCSTRLSEFGIRDRSAIEKIASGINTERLNNNPRRLTHSQLIHLLTSIQ